MLARTHGAREVVKMAGEGEAYEYTGSTSGMPLYAQVFDLGKGQAGYAAIIGDHENWLAVSALNSIRFAPIEEPQVTPVEGKNAEEKTADGTPETGAPQKAVSADATAPAAQ
ncbi:MAG: hypothetical protein J6Z30_05645 [Pyramidobacter sp.]|nr:hypothetical protein [Pyramidobacter sp.]